MQSQQSTSPSAAKNSVFCWSTYPCKTGNLGALGTASYSRLFLSTLEPSADGRSAHRSHHSCHHATMISISTRSQTTHMTEGRLARNSTGKATKLGPGPSRWCVLDTRAKLTCWPPHFLDLRRNAGGMGANSRKLPSFSLTLRMVRPFRVVYAIRYR
jgi:hypothetical protein